MPEGLLLIFSVMWNHQLRFCVSANVSEVPVGRGQEFCLRTGNAAMPGRELTLTRGQDSGRTCLPSCAPGVSANLQSPTHPAPGSPSAAPEAAPVAS